MKRSDSELGMERRISRRDVIHGAGVAAIGLPFALNSCRPAAVERHYPPALTGMRGSHVGSFEIAHSLAREGKDFGTGRDLGEDYDLVVVGGGISGLAAAYYYRQIHGHDARILILENHDDFGGHAKRNEFQQGGQMRMAWGGVFNLEYPQSVVVVDDYATAQKIVDQLSDKEFPVENLCIVRTDLKTVERGNHFSLCVSSVSWFGFSAAVRRGV